MVRYFVKPAAVVLMNAMIPSKEISCMKGTSIEKLRGYACVAVYQVLQKIMYFALSVWTINVKQAENHTRRGYLMKSNFSEIVIRMEKRPCVVNGKLKAIFHFWGNRSKIAPPSNLLGGHNGGVVSGVVGIVEIEDGTILCVTDPTAIRFTDNIFSEYSFDESAKEEE